MTKVLLWDFEGALARKSPDWRLCEGALEVLGALSAKGWRHVVIANGPPELQSLCASLGLSRPIDKVLNATALGAAKPDPRCLALAREAIGPFDEAFVIGDSVGEDIAWGRAVGLPTILVGDAAPQATFCVETLAEIPLALDSWSLRLRAYLP